MLQTVECAINIDVIKDEARYLIERGLLGRQQTIYTMCQFIPSREWESVELELERNGYLLRDHVIALLQPERWDED